MPGEELMTAKEVGDYLRISVWLVWQKAREGSLPSVSIGRNYRFRRTEVERWLARGGTARPTSGAVAESQLAG